MHLGQHHHRRCRTYKTPIPPSRREYPQMLYGDEVSGESWDSSSSLHCIVMVRTMSSTTTTVGARSHTSSRYRLLPYSALAHTVMEWMPMVDTMRTTPMFILSNRT